MCRVLLYFCFILMSSPLLAQSFDASTNARQIILGTPFDVSFTLKNARGSQLRPPSFKDVEVVSGPTTSTSMSIINGQQSSEESYIYTVQPKRVGKLRIGSASIVANGKKMTSKPLTIDAEARIGQQVVLDYKLFTQVAIENYNIISESEYPGFYTTEMREFRGNIIKEVVNGVQYSTKIIKRVALFPQQAGLLTVDAADMQLGISLEDPKNPRRRSFFYTPKVKMHRTKTKEVKISVQDLPPNAPPSFTGAVGKYRITPLIETNTLTTDEALTIRLSINGNGDVKQVQAPPLIL